MCVGFIVLSAMPVVFGWPPMPSAFFAEYPELQEPGRLLLTLVIGALMLLVARLDREERRWKAARLTGFVLLAALLTDVHARTVDAFHLDWQWEQYNGVLRHTYQPPDQYRFLSQGTLCQRRLSLSTASFISLRWVAALGVSVTCAILPSSPIRKLTRRAMSRSVIRTP